MKPEADIRRAIALLEHHAQKVGVMSPEFRDQTLFAVAALEWAVGGKDGEPIQQLLDGTEKAKTHFDAQRN